jgi:hypothetical protein
LTPTLPDPRPPAPLPDAPAARRLLGLGRAALATGDPVARSVHDAALVRELRALCARAADAELAAALGAAPPRLARYLGDRLAEASEPPLEPGQVAARLFAVPLVIVTGGQAPALVPGTVADPAELTGLLTEHRALGDATNAGLGQALCTAAQLAAVPASALWHAHGGAAEAGALAAGLEPTPIRLDDPGEQVHLRFLVGAALVSGSAHDWIGGARGTTAVGAWGLPFARSLGRQLAQPGLALLALPRAPASLPAALAAGAAARAELAFQLFAGSALRRARRACEPTAIVAAHRCAARAGEVRVTLCSAFDEAPLECYRWPLAPADSIEAVGSAVIDLLADCRVTDLVVVPEVQPDRDPHRPSEPLFLTANRLAAAAAPRAHR